MSPCDFPAFYYMEETRGKCNYRRTFLIRKTEDLSTSYGSAEIFHVEVLITTLRASLHMMEITSLHDGERKESYTTRFKVKL